MLKNPFLSRKWWMALLAVVAPIIAKYTGIQIDTGTLVTLILPAVAYIITEGVVDHARAKSPTQVGASAQVRPGAPDLTQLKTGS